MAVYLQSAFIAAALVTWVCSMIIGRNQRNIWLSCKKRGKLNEFDAPDEYMSSCPVFWSPGKMLSYTKQKLNFFRNIQKRFSSENIDDEIAVMLRRISICKNIIGTIWLMFLIIGILAIIF
ncbi:hypothetical protein [Sedimentisphaera salicampi]|uniref:Uncharacterized protein n=1 Tax=Sedimentisphaera salicampi TaxID=1941349 RepID=A0A1W6LMI2_9BACT|nr:hypothetical protein [Sedimentisphaera salicampi]ARN56979.1 hypothetical protein STSP1_01372 [Sedimentisphaera salicampi]